MNPRIPTLYQDEASWARILDALDDEILILDTDTSSVIFANAAARHALGLSFQEPMPEPWQRYLERAYPGIVASLAPLLANVAPQSPQCTQCALVRQSPPRFVELTLSCFTPEPGPVRLLRIKDVTERASLEDKLTRSYSLYQFLAQANKALLEAESECRLFEALCQAAVRAYTIRLAWIGRLHGDAIEPLCHAGHDQGYLESIRPTLATLMRDDNPIGQALRERRVICINDLARHPKHQAALAQGFQAFAAIPIWDDTDIYGVLVVYSSRKEAFDSPLMALLGEIGSDISIALANMRGDTRRRAVETQLRQLSQAVEQSGSAVAITNLQGILEYANPKFFEITGYPPNELLGQSILRMRGSATTKADLRRIQQVVMAGNTWSGELEGVRKSGRTFWSRQTISPLRDPEGQITHFVITGEDYTSLYHAQRMVQQLAYYDPLTSLPNRRLFIDRLNQACQAASRYGQRLAILYLDLDGFKQVNDTLGHAAGDEMLTEIASRIKNRVRASDTVARLGGDEFVVLVTHLKDRNQAAKIARKILEATAEPIVLRDHLVEVTTSIGITTFPEDGEDVDRLLRNADMAMYAAKSQGRNNFQFYTESMNERFVRKLALEKRLREAIERECFELHYQPQIDLANGNLIGVEALVRWIDPEQGMIPPDEFISLAEESGLIVALGDLVLRMACQQARRFQAENRQLKVAVNLSAYQFGRSELLLKSLRRELLDEGLDPSYLELELTESTLIENIDETVSVLEEFQRFGISVAIDDFGTGYSSLSYLKSLPINLLKIDRKFVRELPEDTNDAAITTAVIAMAHELGIRVLAEGVENEDQLQFLKSHGCDQAQGYLFSAPLPLEKLNRYIENFRPLELRSVAGPGPAPENADVVEAP